MTEIISPESGLVRPSGEQLALRATQLYENAVKKAEQSFQRESVTPSEDLMKQRTKEWVETSIENLRGWATPDVELSPATGFAAEMFPGYTKEDLAKVADILATKLEGTQ